MNILGIDFEDWFHPELIKRTLKNDKYEPKVINGLEKILEFLRKKDTLATFFVVGELLKYKPEIQDKILNEGHEIGFHTMYHSRLDDEGFRKKFPDELKEFSDITNKRSKGFRAPTFSLNQNSSWAIDDLVKAGYTYDSSIVPAKTTMYGMEDVQIKPYRMSSKNLKQDDPNGEILEFPILTTKFLGKKIPAGGGFFLRTLPFSITKKAIHEYEKQNLPGTFYIHSWELTPEYMPKIKLSKKDSFVTYHNLDKVMSRMDELLSSFQFTSFEKFVQNNF